jgi:hypothetical protein
MPLHDSALTYALERHEASRHAAVMTSLRPVPQYVAGACRQDTLTRCGI